MREQLGVPAVTTHSFRKSVATLTDDRGLSATRIGADQLGHARPSMTQDRYMARGNLHSEVMEAIYHAASGARVARAAAEPKKALKCAVRVSNPGPAD